MVYKIVKKEKTWGKLETVSEVSVYCISSAYLVLKQ